MPPSSPRTRISYQTDLVASSMTSMSVPIFRPGRERYFMVAPGWVSRHRTILMIRDERDVPADSWQAMCS
jgi:hypothetical protein